MINKYVYGDPFETDAVIKEIEEKKEEPAYGEITGESDFTWSYEKSKDDMVFGLGEANRGINKRGYIYESNCSDDPNHTEDKISLYGAHNFIIVSGKVKSFGLFVDYPGFVTFDIGYTKTDWITIHCEEKNLKLYVIDGASAYDIVKEFRGIIGRSYIPPKFAFGYGQSRWGYVTQEDFKEVVRKHREAHVPLDLVYMDIDYMEGYKDFTFNESNFPDFGMFVQEMRKQHIHMVPIIDAGVKIEKGYDVYEEGKEKGYFCKREDGSDFEAAVWPGLTHFPDVLNKDAREWFGNQYDTLISKGIDAFWNDMNEPSIFYTPEHLEQVKKEMEEIGTGKKEFQLFNFLPLMGGLSNNREDYKRFYHNVNGKLVRHDKVHNLFGYNMTRAAGEAFERLAPNKRILMFSRSSYIGMHRYGGIWTGDNKSWWAHILLAFKMMPSLNMCGFLYAGPDLGGFEANSTRDLVLRFLQLGVFTPLMRNHNSLGMREHEFYQFEHPEDFKNVIETRYRLIPYLYSEYMKAALNNDMYFKPMAFVYPEDEIARTIEDQMMIGNEIMIAPVYTQNAKGRLVYLPEEMCYVRFTKEGIITKYVETGAQYVPMGLDEVGLFVRKNHKIPVADSAETVDAINYETIQYVGYSDAEYSLYNDDGISTMK